MIDLPPKLIIEAIDKCCFIHFKDIKHAPGAPPHLYFVIPMSRNPTNVCLISIVTSKWEKKINYYEASGKKQAANSLVRLQKGNPPFISEECAIDCNQTEQLTTGDLLKRIKKEFGFKVRSGVTQDLINRVVSAIHNSPMIPPALKKTLQSLTPLPS